MLALGLVTVAWLAVRGARRIAGLTVLTIAGALALGIGLHFLVRHPLPPGEPFWRLTEYAFPHLTSLISVVVYGWFAFLVSHGHQWQRQLNAATVAAGLVLSSGVLALYVGQARFSDVIAGLALGLGWLGLPLVIVQRSAPDPSGV